MRFGSEQYFDDQVLGEYQRAIPLPDVGAVFGRGGDGRSLTVIEGGMPAEKEEAQTSPEIGVAGITLLHNETLGPGPGAHTLNIEAFSLTNGSERIVTTIEPPGGGERAIASFAGLLEIPSLTDRSSAHNRLLAMSERFPEASILAVDTAGFSTFVPGVSPLEAFHIGLKKARDSAQETIAILRHKAGDKEITVEALSGGSSPAIEMFDINADLAAEEQLNIAERAHLSVVKMLIDRIPETSTGFQRGNEHIVRAITIAGFILHASVNLAETTIKNPADVANSTGIVKAILAHPQLAMVALGNFVGHTSGTDYELVERVLQRHIFDNVAGQNCALREEAQAAAMMELHPGRFLYRLAEGHGHISLPFSPHDFIQAHFPDDTEPAPDNRRGQSMLGSGLRLASGAVLFPIDAVRKARRLAVKVPCTLGRIASI